MKHLLQSLRLFLLLTLLTGVIYPLAIWGASQLLMPGKANGDLLFREGSPIGSRLIGQSFATPNYFQPRPSATNYHTLPSGASNLGPTSKALKEAVEQRREALLAANDLPKDYPLPSDLLFASGSGLDPHISPAAAKLQIDRILKARGFSGTDAAKAKARLNSLIAEHTLPPQWGILGNARINVLELNIALDHLLQIANNNRKS